VLLVLRRYALERARSLLPLRRRRRRRVARHRERDDLVAHALQVLDLALRVLALDLGDAVRAVL